MYSKALSSVCWSVCQDIGGMFSYIIWASRTELLSMPHICLVQNQRCYLQLWILCRLLGEGKVGLKSLSFHTLLWFTSTDMVSQPHSGRKWPVFRGYHTALSVCVCSLLPPCILIVSVSYKLRSFQCYWPAGWVCVGVKLQRCLYNFGNLFPYT